MQATNNTQHSTIKLKIHTLDNFGNNSTQTSCTYDKENPHMK